jgi:hypothetical protein
LNGAKAAVEKRKVNDSAQSADSGSNAVDGVKTPKKKSKNTRQKIVKSVHVS